MKAKFLLLSLMLSVLSITNLWAADATYSMTPDKTTTGSSATSYITSLTEFTHSEISWKMNQWNPSTLQIKTNQSSAGSEFRFYNTSAFSGRIKSVVVKFSALTLSSTTTSGFKFVGGTSEVTATTGGTDGTWNSTAKTLTWTPSSTDNFTFFAMYQNGKVATGTNKLATADAIVVTYESGGGGDIIVKTLKSIAVTGMTTSFDQNDAFSFDGTCTATYSVTKNSEPQADEDKAVTPTSVTEPDMSTIGDKTITVTYTEGEGASAITKTAEYIITVSAPEGDKLTRASTGISGNNYVDWADVAGASGAVYVGNSAGGNDAIQLRSNNSNSGIVSTTSGGLIKKVKVAWQSGTDNARVLNVYGSHVAYEAATDLYDTNKQGTLLGTFAKSAGNATLDLSAVTERYEYVGVRSNSGAMYLESVTFVWEPGKQLSSIAVKTNPTKESYMIGETFDAAGLVITATYDDSSTEDVAYADNEDKFSFSGFNSSSAAASQEITVTYGGKTTTFNVDILDVTLQSVTVSGTPTTLSYTAGDTFDPAGLIVTGHYSDNSDALITSGISWSYPDADATLTAGKTSIRVIATVEEIASAAYTVSGLTVAAAPLVASWVASEQGYNDQTDMTAQSIAFGPSSNFSLVFAKGTNSNAPKYYNSGTAVRAYGGNTFALSSTDYKFTQIVIAFSSGEGSNTISTNVGTYEDGTWTGNSKEVTFTIGGTTGHRRIASVTVTYEEALPSAATPTFSVEAGTYFEAQNVTITTTTEGATIYYTTDGTEPTSESSVYTDPIAVSTDMTIKAFAAKDGMDNSAVASATYIMGPIFTSLEDLVAADLSSNTMVKVSFSNVAIKTIDSNKKYVTFDIQKEDKDIEIYYNAATLPTNWVVDGTLSGTILAPWKRYPATGTLNCWELAPEAGWAWTELTYISPIVKTIDHVTVSGTATKTAYIDGEVFDPAGLVVTLYYTDETNEVVTDGITWAPATALTVGMTSVDVTATVENVTSVAYPVTVSVSEIPTKTITEFITNQGGRCYLVGVVSNFANSNKNATLTDNSGSILLYNISKNGEVTDFVTLEVEEGDRIKVIATTYQLFYEKDEVVAPEFVEKLAPEVVPVTGVTLPATASVKKGKTVALTATIEPALATDKAVSWSSNAEGVATVDENGEVSGVAEGTANITVTTHDGGYTATCTVTVAEGPDFAHGDWMLVTDANELTAGSYVIIAAAEYNKAMKPYVSGNNCQSKDATKSGSMITYDSEFGIFEVQAGTKGNTIALFDEDNSYYLYAASGSSNHLKGKAELDDNGSWAVSMADGVATLTAQGTNSHNIIKYNSNNDQQLFSCYASGQKDIALYKYYAPVPKVTYDKNTTDEVTNMPNPSVQRTVNNKATIAEGPSRTGYSFEGWKNGSTTYTVGQEYTFTEDITLYAQWKTIPVYTVTYIVGGTGTIPAVASYPAGSNVTLATVSDLNNPGYLFSGWTVEDAEHNVLPVDDNGQFTMPNSNVKVIAKWARATNDKWVLVTDVTNLKTDGTKYLIASAEEMTDGKYYAMAEQKSNNRAAVEVMHSEGIIRGSSVLAAFVLEDAGNGMFAIKANDGYLYAAGSDKNYLRTQTENNDNGKWTITIIEGVASIVATNSANRNVMQFNYSSNNQLFSCYKEATYQSLAIYAKAPMVEIKNNETVEASTVQGSDIVIHTGGTLTVDDATSIGDLYVEEGGKVALASNKLTVVGRFVIETTMAGGQSGQLTGATATNIDANEAYIDITLGAGATSQQWHAFTVPFPVDALNGIYDLDGNKLKNELNYAIMDYHGDIRAQGKYGWKKYRGILVPGTFYLMTVDGERTTYRFKKTNGSSVVSANAKQLTPYAKSGDGQDADANWNGVGNPTLTYGKVGYNVYVLNPDPNVYDYELKPANEHNFVVGTPFFIQASASGTMAMDNIDGSKPYYAPARVANKTDKVTIALSNEDYTDYLYISASEDARNEYELGKDLVTMRMSATPRVPRIAAKAYNTELAMIYTPLNNDMATCDLSLYAPANGEYTLSVAESDDEVLLAYDGQPIWNLTADPFVLDLERGTNKHYSLFILPNNAPTDIETIGNGPLTNDVRKVLFNGQLFIIRDGRIYDATGKATK